MKKLEQMKNWLTKQIDLPVDVLMDLPRITLVGQVHIYIENHRGLLVFSDKEVRLLLKHGQLLIKGQSFIIKTILPEELLLEGIIEQVTFLENEKRGVRETSICEVFLRYFRDSTLLFILSRYLWVVKLFISFSYELFC